MATPQECVPKYLSMFAVQPFSNGEGLFSVPTNKFETLSPKRHEKEEDTREKTALFRFPRRNLTWNHFNQEKGFE